MVSPDAPRPAQPESDMVELTGLSMRNDNRNEPDRDRDLGSAAVESAPGTRQRGGTEEPDTRTQPQCPGKLVA